MSQMLLSAEVCPIPAIDGLTLVLLGGGAGCVIAARLAEALPNLDVLLVEKGADNRSAPRLARELMRCENAEKT